MKENQQSTKTDPCGAADAAHEPPTMPKGAGMYPHEQIWLYITTGQMPRLGHLVFLILGYGLLIIATGITSIIALDLPKSPDEMLIPFLGGMFLIAMLGTACHLMTGKKYRKERGG